MPKYYINQEIIWIHICIETDIAYCHAMTIFNDTASLQSPRTINSRVYCFDSLRLSCCKKLACQMPSFWLISYVYIYNLFIEIPTDINSFQIWFWVVVSQYPENSSNIFPAYHICRKVSAMVEPRCRLSLVTDPRWLIRRGETNHGKMWVLEPSN